MEKEIKKLRDCAGKLSNDETGRLKSLKHDNDEAQYFLACGRVQAYSHMYFELSKIIDSAK